MDKSWKRQLGLGINEDGCGSWNAEMLKTQYLVGPEKQFLTLAFHSPSPRQEGLLEMIPT